MDELFAAKSLGKSCEREYFSRYFPNNDVLSRQEYTDKYQLPTLPYSSLGDREIWGMPYCVDRSPDGKLNITFQEVAHTLVVGTTQVGKTWGHVMDSMYALSAKKNKPCFMVADPKGEISENTAQMLKQRGYRIYALNFKDTQYSNMWNPLLDIYDNWMELNSIEDKLKFHSTLHGLGHYTMEDEAEAFQKAGCFWSFGGKAYANETHADVAVANEKGVIESKASDLVNQLVAALGASAVQNSKDPGWQQGALEILRGMIYLMLEDALDERSGFTRKNMNFMNMQRYYEIIRQNVLSSGNTLNVPLLRVKKLWHKHMTDESIRHIRAYFDNAPSTSRSYLGVFENIMQGWFNPKIYALANDNNIDLNNYEDQPFAVFLITRDYEKSDYFIAGRFVDWVYKEMLMKAEDNRGKLEREMFFILDEFANIPVINGFTNKISTSLSRRIIFQLYVQSYEQLEGNYGLTDAGTIRSNCNVEIFLGSQSYKTKREFSEKCGTRRIKTLEAALLPDKSGTMEVPVLSINSLENLEQGDAYVKRLNRPVSKSHYEMAFLCQELEHDKFSAKQLGIRSQPYNDEIFVYQYLGHEESMEVHGVAMEAQREKAAS